MDQEAPKPDPSVPTPEVPAPADNAPLHQLLNEGSHQTPRIVDIGTRKVQISAAGYVLIDGEAIDLTADERGAFGELARAHPNATEHSVLAQGIGDRVRETLRRLSRKLWVFTNHESKPHLFVRQHASAYTFEEETAIPVSMDVDDDPLNPNTVHIFDGSLPALGPSLEPLLPPPAAPGHSEFTIRFAIQMIRNRYWDVEEFMRTRRGRAQRDAAWHVIEPRWLQACERIEALERDRSWQLLKPVLRHAYSRPEDERVLVNGDLVYAHRLERMVDALALKAKKTADEVMNWRLDEAYALASENTAQPDPQLVSLQTSATPEVEDGADHDLKRVASGSVAAHSWEPSQIRVVVHNQEWAIVSYDDGTNRRIDERTPIGHSKKCIGSTLWLRFMEFGHGNSTLEQPVLSVRRDAPSRRDLLIEDKREQALERARGARRSRNTWAKQTRRLGVALQEALRLTRSPIKCRHGTYRILFASLEMRDS